MARRTTRGTSNLSPEQELLKAQADRLDAETEQGAEELTQKGQLAREQMSLEQLLGQGKLDLGTAEIGSKERQGRLAAALEALGLSSKANIAREGERGAIASDLAKRPDIDQKVLASALAESGQPGLYNALAKSEVDKREKLINATIPALRAAGSDADREKKIKPTLETAFPGSYQEALARAFPKPGQAVPAPTPNLWQGGTPATGESEFSGLVNRLLGNDTTNIDDKLGAVPRGAFTGPRATGSGNQYPVLPATPETNYTGIGHDALEGSTRTDLVGGNTRLGLPSGGTATVRTPSDNTRLDRLIAPRAEPIQTQPQLGATTPIVPASLLATNNAPTPTNEAVPSVVPTPTVAPVTTIPPPTLAAPNVATTPTPQPLDTLLELIRRSKQQPVATQ